MILCYNTKQYILYIYILTLTFCQTGHELQASRGSEVDAGALQLIRVQEGGGAGGVAPLSHMTHLHGPAGQLEPVQLLQGLLGTLCVCKLTHTHTHTLINLSN